MTSRPVPCANLIERQVPECGLAMKFPEDCDRCDQYQPGLNEQERTRCEAWARACYVILE